MKLTKSKYVFMLLNISKLGTCHAKPIHLGMSWLCRNRLSQKVKKKKKIYEPQNIVNIKNIFNNKKNNGNTKHKYYI